MAHRLFIAVPVRLYRYETIRREYGPVLEGRWREESTLHVTVAFLGNAFEPSELMERLEPFSWEFTPTELDTLEYFSSSRVFVATTINPSLQRMRDRLEAVLGLPHEQLRPHATLMRVKRISDKETFLSSLPKSFPEALGILEPKVSLYESRLTPEGARYTVRKEWSA